MKLNSYDRAIVKVSRNWLILLACTFVLSAIFPLLAILAFIFAMFAIRDPISTDQSKLF
jgi:hypothetical protein